MTETLKQTTITNEVIISELQYFYPNIDYTKYNNVELTEAFNKHVSENAVELTAGEVVEMADKFILIDSPDGFQPIGDFYFKKPRHIFKVTLVNGSKARVSNDHLFETESGWKKAEDLTTKDSILTRSGFFKIKSCSKGKKELVYDWEVLHANHRYWAGDGLSSHNTGKTFLTLNVCREAQKMGYHIIYCDSEAAIDETLMINFGINPEEVRYQPVSTSLEVRHFVANLCDTLRKAKDKGQEVPKIMLVLDSLGNLATTKERNDAASGSEKKDMTKQQDLRSLFRVITTDLAEFKIPFIFTNHTYACALGDTEIQMADGTCKRLDEVNIGDMVMTTTGVEPVLETFKYDNTRTIKLYFESDIIIECSPLHLFLCNEHDLLDSNSWVSADEIEEDESVFAIGASHRLKLLKKEQGGINTVYDIEVANAHHYISKDGIVMHNSVGSYVPTQVISGGGGAIYNASIILQLFKSGLKEDGTNKTGIIVTSKTAKNRFAKPINIKFHISFIRGMNRFVGLEDYINWETSGIQKGKIITQKEFDKKTADARALIENTRFEHLDEKGNLVNFYFEAKDTSRTIAVRHLCENVKLQEFFTPKVITQEVLVHLDNTVIKKAFMLPTNSELSEEEDEIANEILNEDED